MTILAWRRERAVNFIVSAHYSFDVVTSQRTLQALDRVFKVFNERHGKPLADHFNISLPNPRVSRYCEEWVFIFSSALQSLRQSRQTTEAFLRFLSRLPAFDCLART